MTCDLGVVTPIMEIHSTADEVVPFDGDNNFIAPIDAVMTFGSGTTIA